MTVKELRDKLNEMAKYFPRHDDDEVRVVVRKNTMGGVPTVKVKRAHSGIDWNKGQFLIWTEKDLIEKP